ncbi:uncharacterized protein LOC135645385 isoform X1 [Musa acuminata AAA Group]|uniref:uncharacterized protein LOC135645385 isoform X1 n=1 Tax=Musa acuminata AAA Group TaxID=214697 RepID=UPI0031D2EFE6
MVFPVFRCCSVLTLSVIVSCQPSEQYDEDCDTLTVWLKQGSDLSAFVHCASEDHMKALFDLLEILKDLEVVVVKGTVECEASILLRSVFITRLPCKVEYLGELIKNKMASTDVVQKYPKVSGEQMGTAEDIGNKKLYADSATSLRFVYNGPRTSVMLIETAHNPAVPCEIIKVLSELNCYVESAVIETEERIHVFQLKNFLMSKLTHMLISNRAKLLKPNSTLASGWQH